MGDDPDVSAKARVNEQIQYVRGHVQLPGGRTGGGSPGKESRLQRALGNEVGDGDRASDDERDGGRRRRRDDDDDDDSRRGGGSPRGERDGAGGALDKRFSDGAREVDKTVRSVARRR